MYQNTITVFNFHKATGMWFKSVVRGADLIAAKSNNNTSTGLKNATAVDIIVPCFADKSVETVNGKKLYLGPKAFSVCTDPENFITFAPGIDFVYAGICEDFSERCSDDDFDEGLYHCLNSDYDDIYLIHSANYFGLLPHFEIEGR